MFLSRITRFRVNAKKPTFRIKAPVMSDSVMRGRKSIFLQLTERLRHPPVLLQNYNVSHRQNGMSSLLSKSFVMYPGICGAGGLGSFLSLNAE